MLALEVFCYRIRKYVGAYLAVLEGAEALVFTGGIGENAPEIRRRVCEGFGWAGLTLDPERNRRNTPRISADGSALAAYAIPTDEECLIAKETLRLMRAGLTQRHNGDRYGCVPIAARLARNRCSIHPGLRLACSSEIATSSVTWRTKLER